MEGILHQLQTIGNYVFDCNGTSHLPTGAGFLPCTVWKMGDLLIIDVPIKK
jgi:hypothetical protein